MPYKILFKSNLPREKWKPICGYCNYEISNMGRVKSISRKIKMPNSGYVTLPTVIMSHGTNNNDYLYVTLVRKCGCKKTITIQRLVATHFVRNPKPEKYNIIRHLDNNKSNNKSSNLRWSNHSINNQQAYDDGLKKGAWTGIKGSRTPWAKQVDQFSKDGSFIKRHLSRVEASELTGVPFGQINNVASGRGKTAGGFIWRAV